MLATGGLTEKDVKPVMVPNVMRGADDFTSGANDMFLFAFGAPKVREVDATVGGIRAVKIPDSGMAAARQDLPLWLSHEAVPNPSFVGVDRADEVYAWDNILFTNAKMKDDVVYKIIDTMENNKADMVAVRRRCTNSRRRRSTSTTYLPSWRAEILQGPQHPGQGAPVNEPLQ